MKYPIFIRIKNYRRKRFSIDIDIKIELTLPIIILVGVIIQKG